MKHWRYARLIKIIRGIKELKIKVKADIKIIKRLNRVTLNYMLKCFISFFLKFICVVV